jgi:hypothetical protein
MLRAAHRRLVLTGILLVVTIATALAQTEKVYVTRTGEKYHRASCSSLRSSKIEMPLAEAAARYGACKICRPPVPAAASQSAAAEPRSSPPASAAPAPRSTRCQATTKKGTQCSRSAQAGSSYCWQHAR